jgi:protein SCO1
MRLRIFVGLLIAALGFNSWRASEVRVPALPFYSDSTLTPAWTADTGTVHRIEKFSLIDQRGRPVSELDLNGRITVVTFFYATCKDLCPRLQSKLAAVRDVYRDDPRVLLVSISISPEHDTAPILAEYAKANHIDALGWLLMTGARPEVERVAHASFFANTPVVRAAGTTHGETIWLIDQSRRIRGLYNGTMPLDSKRLMEDIATLAGPRGG